MNNNISFKSRIHPVTLNEFTNATTDIYQKASVNYPWTSNETIKAPKAYTMDIFDCSAGGIVDKDSGDVVMFHICPSQPDNFDFDKVEENIMALVNKKNSNLRGFILGAQTMFEDSIIYFKKMNKMLEDKHIPTSTFKSPIAEQTHILYDAQKDEWLISNVYINSALNRGKKDKSTILKENFAEVNIANGDYIV